MKKRLRRTKSFLQKEIDPAFARRAKIIFENLELKHGLRILSVGCGRGFYEMALSSSFRGIEIVGTDNNEKYLNNAKHNIKQIKLSSEVAFLKADATKLPFTNNSFDRVICSEVLEHIPNDHKAIKEIYRVLKKKGIAILTVPHKNYPFFWDPLNYLLERIFKTHIPSNIWWLAGIWADHVRLYTEKQLKIRLNKASFKIRQIWHATHYAWPFCHFFLYGIGKNLVERGLVNGGCNRFDFTAKPSFALKVVKYMLNIIDQKNDKNPKGKKFVNLIVKIEK